MSSNFLKAKPQKKSSGKTSASVLLKHMKRCRSLYLMLVPSIITVIIFYYVPLYGVQIAFKDYRSSLGIWDSPWVGLKHFKTFVNYPYFTKIFWNTLSLSLASLSTFPCSIIFALMLNEMKDGKLKKVCQQLTYAPHFVSTVVVCSMAILFLNREGLINIILGFLGMEAVDFMSMPSAFAPVYVITGLWSNLGWGTIIYLATLSSVSPELIEAAKIDGASRLQIIWHVNLPHLKPTIVTMFILRLGNLLSVGFEKIFLLQNPLNLEVSSVISTYTYEMGILNQQFSYSTAIGLFNNIIDIIMVVMANKISNKVAQAGLW